MLCELQRWMQDKSAASEVIFSAEVILYSDTWSQLRTGVSVGSRRVVDDEYVEAGVQMQEREDQVLYVML